MADFIAIGDIHGCLGMLNCVLRRLPPEGALVFLGDYLDRGPDVRGVIERLMALATERPCVFLRGNHESMALQALEDPDGPAMDRWLMNGGQATLASYGHMLPEAHLAFLRATRYFYRTDRYLFVHGGLRPGKQPEEMNPEELLWIRDPFLDAEDDWGALVVHGHTPTLDGKPERRPNRLNLDTGAVYGGALTAVLLPEETFVSRRPGLFG